MSAHKPVRPDPKPDPDLDPALAAEALPESAAEIDEPSASLAWRILTSPRTFLTLSALLAVVFAIAAFLPQRPTAAELARTLPFASAEAAADLGLTDIVTAWPTLLILLLLALNATGLVLAALSRKGRDLHAPRPTPAAGPGHLVAEAEAELPSSPEALRERLPAALGGRFQLDASPSKVLVARRGLVREGLGVALLGLLTLLAALAVARGSAMEARVTLAPSLAEKQEGAVRDGEVFILRDLPFELSCDRPDPQDPSRTFPCRIDHGAGQAEALWLTPGVATSAGGLTFSPLRERLRSPARTEAIDLVLSSPTGLERLRLEPGKIVALASGGEQLTAFHGPDGPMVVVQPKDGPARLLLPESRPEAAATNGGLRFQAEAELPTRLELDAMTHPERPLVLAGLGLLILGLLLAGLSPHLRVELTATARGTRVHASSLNRPTLPAQALAALSGQPSPTVRSKIEILVPQAIGLALAVAGLALGLLAFPASPALVLGLAALVSAPSRATLPLGALTLVAGAGTPPHALGSPLELALPLATGLALGLLCRELARDRYFQGRHELVGGLLALVLAVALALPLPHVQLVDANGPAMFPALLSDGDTLMRVLWPVPAYLPAPGSLLTTIAAVFALVAAFVLFAAHLRGADKGPLSPFSAARVGVLAGALGVAAGVLGLLALVETPSLDPETLRRAFDLAASRDGSVLAVHPTPTSLGLASRPFLDGLRLLAGLGLVLTFILRRKQPLPATATGAGLTLSPLSYAALALAALAVFTSSLAGPGLTGLTGAALMVLAGATLLAGALLAAGRGMDGHPHAPPPTLAARIGLLGAALLLAASPLLPLLYGA